MRERARIAVVEDERDIREAIARHLERHGFVVRSYGDGERALAALGANPPDLVLLDRMLPGRDGMSVLAELKRREPTARVPVILVTARDDEAEVVEGLEAGADDYIRKPFGLAELLARVQAALRRHTAARRGERPTDDTLHYGPIELEPARHEVRVEGRVVRFTAAEFRLLFKLLRHPGRVFRRVDLLEATSGHDAIVTERTVDVHIRALRRKLGAHRDLIETVHGVGYRAADLARRGEKA